MGWDIYIQDFPASARTVEDIPADFAPESLGTRAEIIARICEIAPFADFSDPSYGRIEGSDFSVEVNLGRAELVGSVVLHVRGGDTAAGCVAAIIKRLGHRAIDTSAGDFFKPENALASLRQWRVYRDHVVGDNA